MYEKAFGLNLKFGHASIFMFTSRIFNPQQPLSVFYLFHQGRIQKSGWGGGRFIVAPSPD